MSEFIPAQLDLLLHFFHSLNTKLIFYKKTFFCEQADIINESCGFRNRAWGQTCARQPSASNFFLADVYSIEGQWINSYKGLSECPPRSRHPQGRPPGAETPCSACWDIRSTSGRYASYWNAILFMQFSAKKIQNKTNFVAAAPTSGKSWIHH